MLTKTEARRRPFLLLGLAIAGALLFAACGSADVSPDVGGGVAPPGEPGAEQPSGEGRDSSVSDVASGGAGGSFSLNDRKIIRTATIELQVSEVPDAVQEVQDIARRARGFVAESRVSLAPDEDDEQNATVVIRVPADAFEDVMTDLRGVADVVTSETTDASEVTEEFTDLEARLRNLEATERQYIQFLDRAESIEDVLAVQARLDQVRLEIEQVQGRLNVLNDLTELATITVQLAPLGAAVEGGQHWAVEALDTAWEVSLDALVVLGTAAIAIGVLMVWLAVLGAAGAFAWRLVGRKILAITRRIYEF